MDKCVCLCSVYRPPWSSDWMFSTRKERCSLIWHAHHPPNCSSVVCRLDTDVCVSASKSVCAKLIRIQSNCCSWKWGQNRIPSSPLTYKTPLMQADPWKYMSSALLHPLSIISSHLVPSAVCTVISPCTDADQMECWKMKAVTDKEGKVKIEEHESQEGRVELGWS